MLLGAHVSIAGGLHNAFGIAQEIGCTAMQIFTKNATRWHANPLREHEIRRFGDAWASAPIQAVVAHSSYLINLGTSDDALQEKSRAALLLELQRCEQLNIPYLTLHPGAHGGAGEAEGLRRIAASIDALHALTPGYHAQIILENTAGQGTHLGYDFAQLARICALVKAPERVGVCFDTCHAFAAGYELRTESGYHATFAAFDTLLGLERLKALHVNDSQKGLRSRVDRHEAIGAGAIGIAGFRLLMNDARFAMTPKILETPKGSDPIAADRANLAVLRGLMQDS